MDEKQRTPFRYIQTPDFTVAVADDVQPNVKHFDAGVPSDMLAWIEQHPDEPNIVRNPVIGYVTAGKWEIKNRNITHTAVKGDGGWPWRYTGPYRLMVLEGFAGYTCIIPVNPRQLWDHKMYAFNEGQSMTLEAVDHETQIIPIVGRVAHGEETVDRNRFVTIPAGEAWDITALDDYVMVLRLWRV